MSNSHSDSARAVFDRISSRPRLAPDRMPVLNAIMERLAVAGTELLRRFCAQPMVLSVGQSTVGKSSELIEFDRDSIATVYLVPEWDNTVLIGVDRTFVDAIIEASLGGDGVEASPSISRPFSLLDVRVVRPLLDHIATALAESFQAISKITLVAERTESRLDPQILGVKPFDVIVTRFVVQAFGEEATLFVYLPAASLAQFRVQFERTSASNQPVDPSWAKQLEVELGHSTVELQAVLGVLHLTLSEISRLQVGQIVDLGVAPGSPVALEGAGEHLFNCRVGQSNRIFAVTIEEQATA